VIADSRWIEKLCDWLDSALAYDTSHAQGATSPTSVPRRQMARHKTALLKTKMCRRLPAGDVARKSDSSFFKTLVFRSRLRATTSVGVQTGMGISKIAR